MQLIIAEKPSVAQSIAAALGVKEKKQGYMQGSGYLVSWRVGHLVELAQPEAYGDYTLWEYEDLPILPMVTTFQMRFRRLVGITTGNLARTYGKGDRSMKKAVIASVKQALSNRGFLIGVTGVIAVILLASVKEILSAFRSETMLSFGLYLGESFNSKKSTSLHLFFWQKLQYVYNAMRTCLQRRW